MRKLVLNFILLAMLLLTPLKSSAELLYKLKPMRFDISGSVIFVPTISLSKNNILNNMTVVKDNEKKTVTLNFTSSTALSQPENLLFSEGDLKELQLKTNMNNTVSLELFFKEDYNLANLKIGSLKNNIYIYTKNIQPYGMNYYLNAYTEDTDSSHDYKESLIITSKKLEKDTPVSALSEKNNKTTLNEINQAFLNSNSQSNEVYTNYEIVNETQNNVLRSRFYLNNITSNGKLFAVSGVGLLSLEKQFLLDNPARMVFDLPNTILKSELHNKELELLEGDKIKVAQFSPTTTRIVVTSKDASKYLPIYFSDSQKVLLSSPQNLLTSDLPPVKANIVKTSYQKSGKLCNLIFEFDKPLTYSVKRMSDTLFIYFLNAEKFNEANFNSTIKQTPYSQTAINIMKSSGIRLALPMANKSNLNTYLSPEGRVFKISFEEVVVKQEQKTAQTPLQKIKKKEGTITATPKYNNPKGSNVIILDAGHGGKDCGATREGIYEKDITLDVCDRLQSILQKKGFKVYMTRTNDTFVSLEDRALFNESINPAIFVSVHVNSCNDESPRGIETHYYTDESLELGAIVNKALTSKIPTTPNRGLLRSRFYVINHTVAPAILVEIGFISNNEERKSLITPQRKQLTAEGIANGIIEYFNSINSKK